MKNYILGLSGLTAIALFFITTSWTTKKLEQPKMKTPVVVTVDSVYDQHVTTLYNEVHLKEAGLSKSAFEKALTGFYNLKKAGQLSQKSILTIADFDQLSTQKRLYIIDLDKKEILLNTWVAHGQRSGKDEAVNFSNKNESYTSSLGFYVTGEVYKGIHGKSLKLDGMDNGFNNNARSRAIVVHGAPYVSKGTIKALGRLGRSQGCPAVAPEIADKVINTIGDKTVLFINKSEERYSSKYLDHTLAANFALEQQSTID
ncbi:murein L,D-transpeptidase catalytic domain family protein [Pedobacter insulae]|uniref:L,D-transpeptidase catalytic domain n=1 Tax=Pedobacter insulae TaxID=414048 RepID=A0A1I2VK82_9SPHI|nr:murein L,D-transpeptidase catalytic domain family protein [Pedobacter insulae]SFG89678.1 L,D-transpeptidase catalytic domain [Pedobacter insulae]